MGSGLLILISVGKQNLYLTNNPDITFFKVAYRRHTNFSIEIVPQYFKATPNFGKKVSVSISKNADLISQMYLYVRLPSIPKCYHSVLPDNIKKFKWINKIGWAIIRSIDIEIGGLLIDRHYGDWLNIWSELSGKNLHRKGLKKMIGDVDELTTLSNGKESYDLYIPLQFWFCRNYGLALPLIALIHNDVKIHVEFNSFSKCYVENPTHYITVKENYCIFNENEEISQTINGVTAKGKFIYFDVTTNRLYYEKWYNDFLSSSSSSTQSKYVITGKDTGFQITPELDSSVIKDESYFKNVVFPSIIESYMLINYIYLDNQERIRFLNSNHEYLIDTLQNIPETIIYSNNSAIKLNFIHPCKEIIWRFQMNFNFDKNDAFNYSLNINDEENTNEIVMVEKIIINGRNRLEMDIPKYYKLIQNYQNFVNSPSFGIHSYSFSLYPQKYQPSGTMNFSKIDDSSISFNLDRTISYQNFTRLKVYALNYNLLRIVNGIGGLAFSR